MFNLLLVFILIKRIQSIEDCLNLNISITQTIENNGFHNKISWMLEFLTPDAIILKESKSKFALYLNVPSGIYVNPDEIADLSRIGKLSAYIEGDVDIEAAEKQAEPHDVFIFLPEDYGNSLIVTLPVHLRYHMAKIGGGYDKVVLPKPSLLMLTNRDVVKFCNKQVPIRGPCDSKNVSRCFWKSISYLVLFDEVEFVVPLGNVDHFPIVAVVTLVLGCMGCMYILSVLSAH